MRKLEDPARLKMLSENLSRVSIQSARARAALALMTWSRKSVTVLTFWCKYTSKLGSLYGTDMQLLSCPFMWFLAVFIFPELISMQWAMNELSYESKCQERKANWQPSVSSSGTYAHSKDSGDYNRLRNGTSNPSPSAQGTKPWQAIPCNKGDKRRDCVLAS